MRLNWARHILRIQVFSVETRREDNYQETYEERSWRKRMGSRGLDSSGSGDDILAGYCEQINEPSGSMKGGDSLD